MSASWQPNDSKLCFDLGDKMEINKNAVFAFFAYPSSSVSGIVEMMKLSVDRQITDKDVQATH